MVKVNVPNPFKKKIDESALDFRRSMALTEAQKDASTPENDYLTMVGRMGYLLTDEHLENFLIYNPELQPLLAVLSPVNSTTKLDARQAELKRIRVDNFFTMLKLTMSPRIYEANGMEMLDGLRLFAHDRINDAADGWKGRLTTEQTRTVVNRFEDGKGRR